MKLSSFAIAALHAFSVQVEALVQEEPSLRGALEGDLLTQEESALHGHVLPFIALS
jgi:hypothetical protein